MRHNESLKGVSETNIKQCHFALICLKMTLYLHECIVMFHVHTVEVIDLGYSF